MTAFERLFQNNQEYIFKYLMKLTGDISLAEELTQETFFRAYMNYAALRDKDKAPALLCRIAPNAYYAWYNDRKKKDFIHTWEILSDSPDPETLFAQKELSQKALL